MKHMYGLLECPPSCRVCFRETTVNESIITTTAEKVRKAAVVAELAGDHNTVTTLKTLFPKAFGPEAIYVSGAPLDLRFGAYGILRRSGGDYAERALILPNLYEYRIVTDAQGFLLLVAYAQGEAPKS